MMDRQLYGFVAIFQLPDWFLLGLAKTDKDVVREPD
jgi:hypothetical protein